MKINFHFKNRLSLKNRKKLKNFIFEQVILEKKTPVSLSFVFCSDKEVLKINQTYLNHDYYTDIITFDLSEFKSKSIEGEIYISVDRVKENAQTYKNSLSTELHRIIFHGVLHLCGFNDKTQKEKKRMTAKENEWLGKYF